VHQNSKKYEEVISNRRGETKGRIPNEEATREMARKEVEQDEAKISSPIYISTHSGSDEEEEETPEDKKRRDE
jgi:hypothetical protein